MSYFDDMRLHYHSQPHEVSIETQALCNARCTFCPYPTLERIGTKMPDELLDRLMTEMATFQEPFFFSPFKVNEPFLDKRLLPLCQRFNREIPHGTLRLFTNGSALTDKHIEGVAKLKNVAHLWISLNEVDPVKYEKTMGLDFEQTTRRLDSLHAAVKAGRFDHQVVVSRVGTNRDFMAYVLTRWPRFRPVVIKKDAWIDFTAAEYPYIPDTQCGRWWEMNVMATGIVALCCMSSDEKYALGDLNKQTMLDVYNQPTLKARRESMLGRKSQAIEPCQRCSC